MKKNRVIAFAVLFFIGAYAFYYFFFLSQDFPILLSNKEGRKESHQVSSVDGNAFIVWTDYGSGRGDIYVQGLSHKREKLFGESGYAVAHRESKQWNPKVTAVSPNEIYISWLETVSGSNLLFLTKIDRNGKRKWKSPVMIANGDFDNNSQVMIANDKGVILSWLRYDGESSKVRVQFIDNQGQYKWSRNGLIVFESNQQSQPQLAYLDSNSVAVVWMEHTENSSFIKAQKLDYYGLKKWKKEGIKITSKNVFQDDASMKGDGKGGLFVSWEVHEQQNKIFAQSVSREGRLRWPVPGILVSASNRVKWHLTSLLVNGKLAVIWKEEKKGDDVFIQKFSNEGKKLWGLEGKAIVQEQKDQAFIDTESNRKGNILISWQDMRKGTSKIYAQAVDSRGLVKWDKEARYINPKGDLQQLDPKVDFIDDAKGLVVWLEELYEGNYRILAEVMDL